MKKRLLALLDEEYGWYQSVYILIFNAKELLESNDNQDFGLVIEQIRQMTKNVIESERKITDLRHSNGRLFGLVALSLEVTKFAHFIATLIKKNLSMLVENGEFTGQPYLVLTRNWELLRILAPASTD